MAVLGRGGKIRLRREAPDAVVLRPSALHRLSNGLYVRNPSYWSGDQVTLSCDGGLPVDAGDGIAACPDGYGFYADSDWDTGPNRAHVTTDTDAFYAGDDDALMYVTPDDVGLLESASYFVYRDQLDRLSFYCSHDAALRGSKSDRVALCNVEFGALLLAPYGSVDYQNALVAASAGLDLGDYQLGSIDDEALLESAPAYSPPGASSEDYGNVEGALCSEQDSQPDRWLWTVQGQISEWSLSLSAQEIETTAVGEKFGDSVKSVVTGGGTIDFLVARRTVCGEDGSSMIDPTSLMRLLLLSEKGCKADAEFWMIDNQQQQANLLPGDLFYETQMLVTSIAINTRADGLIAGSLNFVTVGAIRLQMGTN